VVNMMTTYLSVCQQQRLLFEYSHTRTAALVFSDIDTSECCVTCLRSIAVFYIFLTLYLSVSLGRDSVVGTATRYGLGSTGLNPRVDEIFHTRPDRLWGPPGLLRKSVHVLSPGGKAAGAWR
jgi:hypothetical protein